MSITEKLCSVTKFIDFLATTNNIAIVTTATAMIDNNVKVLISVFGQGLNLTKKIEKGQINNNQFI